MARRASRTHRSLTTDDRIDRLRAALPQRGDDGPSIATLIDQRHRVQADRARVREWFDAAGAPNSVAALAVCCPQHALRRCYVWVKRDDAIDLDDIERADMCLPLNTSQGSYTPRGWASRRT